MELLNCGMCDVNLQMGEHKSTALHGTTKPTLMVLTLFLAAAFGGHANCLALLFAMGADDTIQNKQGFIARQEANLTVVELFALKQRVHLSLRQGQS
jgi:hypothetical protein